MSLLNSKFDICSVENPLAVAALAQVLAVDYGAAAGLYSTNGTPQTPASAALPPGTVVVMGADGKAVKGDAPVLFIEGAAGNGKELDGTVDPVLPWVTIDGNTEYSGAFVRKVTVLQGGFTMLTDQFDATAGTFDIGKPVTFAGGKIVPRKGAHALKQIYGFVGPDGHNTVTGVVQVVIPQGVGL